LHDYRTPTAKAEQVLGSHLGTGTIRRCDRWKQRLTTAVVDHDDGQALRVQTIDVVERPFRLNHQQTIERLRRYLGRKAAHRLLTAVAGEEQEPVRLRLQNIDRALQNVSHPRPGEGRHQDADGAGPPPRQPDGA
jgi:hypothetical protein